jgi:reactive chlorine resistance protein C
MARINTPAPTAATLKGITQSGFAISTIPTLLASARSRLLTRTAYGLNLIEQYGERLTTVGLYGSLAVVYAWFGGMKFTAYEARGLVDLVSHSPLLSWFYDVLSVQGFSTFLGILELTVGALIAARLVNPALSFAGGLLSAGLFFTTLSSMASTPGVFEPELGFPAISVAPGQFLLKDIGLLAISLWIAVESLRATRRRSWRASRSTP